MKPVRKKNTSIVRISPEAHHLLLKMAAASSMTQAHLVNNLIFSAYAAAEEHGVSSLGSPPPPRRDGVERTAPTEEQLERRLKKHRKQADQPVAGTAAEGDCRCV